MPKTATNKRPSAPPKLYTLQCRACRRFMGIGHMRVTAFCEDIFCLATREWVWDLERETDLIVYLHDVEGLPIADIARELKIERKRAHAIYQAFTERRLNAKM